MSAHLRVLAEQTGPRPVVVTGDLDAYEELIGLRTIKVRCPNRRCGVVVAAGARCGSCNHSLDGATVLHDCLEAGHRRVS